MSRSTRTWLVAAILQTVYLVYVLGQGAIGPTDHNWVYVVPFGELPRVGDSFHTSIVDVVHMLFIALLATWMVWGWQFIQESRGNYQRVYKAETDQEEG